MKSVQWASVFGLTFLATISVSNQAFAGVSFTVQNDPRVQVPLATLNGTTFGQSNGSQTFEITGFESQTQSDIFVGAMTQLLSEGYIANLELSAVAFNREVTSRRNPTVFEYDEFMISARPAWSMETKTISVADLFEVQSLLINRGASSNLVFLGAQIAEYYFGPPNRSGIPIARLAPYNHQWSVQAEFRKGRRNSETYPNVLRTIGALIRDLKSSGADLNNLTSPGWEYVEGLQAALNAIRAQMISDVRLAVDPSQEPLQGMPEPATPEFIMGRVFFDFNKLVDELAQIPTLPVRIQAVLTGLVKIKHEEISVCQISLVDQEAFQAGQLLQQSRTEQKRSMAAMQAERRQSAAGQYRAAFDSRHPGAAARRTGSQ